METFRAMRNAFVHGTRGGSPLKLEAGVHLLRESVLDPQWLAALNVGTPGGPTHLGDVYRRLPSQRSRVRPIGELRKMVKVSRPQR